MDQNRPLAAEKFIRFFDTAIKEMSADLPNVCQECFKDNGRRALCLTFTNAPVPEERNLSLTYLNEAQIADHEHLKQLVTNYDPELEGVIYAISTDAATEKDVVVVRHLIFREMIDGEDQEDI